MTDAHHLLLVLPDRDAADEVAAELAARLSLPEEPEPLRESLAGEDDAEDAQWLVVLPGTSYDAATLRTLATLAEEHEGWLEQEDPGADEPPRAAL